MAGDGTNSASALSLNFCFGRRNIIGLRFLHLAFVTGIKLWFGRTEQPCQPHFAIPVVSNNFMGTLTKLVFLILTIASTTILRAQEIKSTNYYLSIKNFNLSKLWCADSILLQDDGKTAAFPEPLGYIGDSFQRFYIHYTSITKSSENPYSYSVLGKTRVKNNICNFKGTITIEKAKLYNESDDKRFKEGSLVCRVLLFEDSTENSSGFIKGLMTTEFCIDKHKRVYYDAIMIDADGYSNNQCKASWTSYKTKESKKCNWGDFRMPESRGLDSGVGEVYINDKFIKFGWQSFVDSESADEDKAKKASKLEDEKWWK